MCLAVARHVAHLGVNDPEVDEGHRPPGARAAPHVVVGVGRRDTGRNLCERDDRTGLGNAGAGEDVDALVGRPCTTRAGAPHRR
ncbi:MAG TPA: hypothetical protein VF874_00165 [Mycobacterium sp.]